MKRIDVTNLSLEDLKQYWAIYAAHSIIALLAVITAALMPSALIGILLGWLMTEVGLFIFHYFVVEDLVLNRDGWRKAAHTARDAYQEVQHD